MRRIDLRLEPHRRHVGCLPSTNKACCFFCQRSRMRHVGCLPAPTNEACWLFPCIHKCSVFVAYQHPHKTRVAGLPAPTNELFLVVCQDQQMGRVCCLPAPPNGICWLSPPTSEACCLFASTLKRRASVVCEHPQNTRVAGLPAPTYKTCWHLAQSDEAGGEGRHPRAIHSCGETMISPCLFPGWAGQGLSSPNSH